MTGSEDVCTDYKQYLAKRAEVLQPNLR